MGKKKESKKPSKALPNAKQGNNVGPAKAGNLKLSPQKRNDLNQLVDKLLKVSSSVPICQSSNKNWDIHLTIEKILSKIMVLESDLTVTMPPRNDEFIDALTSWMENNGAVIKNMRISEFSNYDYGLKAIGDIKENDLLVVVPRKLMLTTEMANNSILGNLIKTDPLLQSMPNVTLAVFLLIERFNETSFWKPYIFMLPRVYQTVMWFTSDELSQLKGSPTFEPALKQCRNIARQYAYFYSLFQRSSDPASLLLRDIFTYEHYRWAVSTVMTRQNFIPPSEDGEAMVNALIPFWDMFNHTNAKMSTDFVRASERSECYAYRDFAAGEQVFISYSLRPNSEFFLHDGFVYPENVNDSLKLMLGVSRSDPLFEKRSSLLDKLALPISGEFLLMAKPRPIHGGLLAFLRVFCMSEEHLDKWLESDQRLDLNYPDRAVDPGVDSKVWTFLMTRIKLLFAAYPTTLEDDEKLLSSKSKMSPCHRLAIMMRLSEKMILKNAMSYIEGHISE